MMRRGLKKVEMVDAWTQTTPRNEKDKQKYQQALRQQAQAHAQAQAHTQAQGQNEQLWHNNDPQHRFFQVNERQERVNAQHHMMTKGGLVASHGGNNGSAAQAANFLLGANDVAKTKPRASVEHIFGGGHDAKTLQLQQDRRLAQIHRQSTQDQQKLLAAERAQRQQQLKAPYAHTQGHQYSSAQHLKPQQQVHQPTTGPPNANGTGIQIQNQIRIRKDPIKNHQTPGYKKPPSLAIYEETLMKQLAGNCNPAMVNNHLQIVQAQSTLKISQLCDESKVNSNDVAQSGLWMPQKQNQQISDGRSPEIRSKTLKLTNGSELIQQQPRGKTFTTMRLGNIVAQPPDNAQKQFFQYTADFAQSQQIQPTIQQQYHQRGLKNSQVPQSITNNHGKRHHLAAGNREQAHNFANNLPPDSPSKRHHNQMQPQHLSSPSVSSGNAAAFASQQMASQRVPLIGVSLSQTKQQAPIYQQPMKPGGQDPIPLIGGQGKPSITAKQANSIARPSANSALDSQQTRNVNDSNNSSFNKQAGPQVQSGAPATATGIASSVTPQKIAEFRSNRESSFRAKGGSNQIGDTKKQTQQQQK